MVMYENSGYMVSKDGTVYGKNGVKLRGRIDVSGYVRYDLYINGKSVTVNGHKMVAVCYLGGNKPGFQVNHIDGDKTNNCVSNLEWVTSGENVNHAIETGLIKRGISRVGLRRGNYDKVKLMRASGYTKKEISDALGISPSTVSKVKVMDDEYLPEYYERKRARETEKSFLNNKMTSVLQYDKDGVFIKEWCSVSGAAKDARVDVGSMWQCITGKRKSAGGYVWRKKD